VHTENTVDPFYEIMNAGMSIPISSKFKPSNFYTSNNTLKDNTLELL